LISVRIGSSVVSFEVRIVASRAVRRPGTPAAGPGDDFITAQDLGRDQLSGGTGFDRAFVDPDDRLNSIEWTSPPN
jgi:hypothetical protein